MMLSAVQKDSNWIELIGLDWIGLDWICHGVCVSRNEIL